MLILTNVRKTFNKGTINEKKALNGIDLTLNDGCIPLIPERSRLTE